MLICLCLLTGDTCPPDALLSPPWCKSGKLSLHPLFFFSHQVFAHTKHKDCQYRTLTNFVSLPASTSEKALISLTLSIHLHGLWYDPICVIQGSGYFAHKREYYYYSWIGLFSSLKGQFCFEQTLHFRNLSSESSKKLLFYVWDAVLTLAVCQRYLGTCENILMLRSHLRMRNGVEVGRAGTRHWYFQSSPSWF